MTDQQPHTPTLDKALDEIATILARFRSSKESIRTELDQMIAQVEAAAEQRGAERALTDFKRFATRIMPATVTRKAVIADLEIALRRLRQDNHLLMGPLRADQIGAQDG